MRTSMIGAAFLLCGAGAAMVAALEPNGDTIALNGSDTLLDVTRQVIANCPNIGTHGITYAGGGSGVGAGQMLAHAQRLSPMSRALKNSEYCVTSGAAFTAGARPGLAEDLLVGLDGVAIVADQTTSCASTVANGFGKATAFTVFADGVSGTPASCPGCDGSGNYTFTNSFDALKVLYFGLTHDNTYDCNGSVRKSLIKNWANLFADTTCAGAGTCTTGLTHAFRRSDLSGTTDALLGVLSPPTKPGLPLGVDGKAGTVGIGTLSTAPVGKADKMNPFCNSSDANANPPTLSFGGGSDFQDKDPVRISCGAGGATDDVCQGNPVVGASNFRGDLGVVLPVLIPDTFTATANDFYHSANCSTACVLVAPIKPNQIPAGFKCPDGTPTLAGFCYMPATTSGDPRCKSAFSTKCVSSSGKPDGRLYNLTNVISASQVPAGQRGTSPYQMAIDVEKRILTGGAFYRIHETSAGAHNVPDATVGTTGTCRENDDTSQIGCLVNSDPCAVGYAGREAAKFYPGLGSPAIPQPASLKAASINGTPPFTPGADPDAAITNLLQPTGTLPLYPLARRLYVATIYGFGAPPSPSDGSGLQGGEKLLADCFGNNAIVGPAISSHGFVQIPGGVQCLDYPEELGTTSTPAVNVQGPGNVALGGCGVLTPPLVAANACSVSPPTITP
jgi:hypothetical protein